MGSPFRASDLHDAGFTSDVVRFFKRIPSDYLPSAGPCADPGVPVPSGLWSMCLSAPRRPVWASPPGSLQHPPCDGDVASCTVHAPLSLGNGTKAFVGQPLWFGIFVTNPYYMPFDNTWLLAVLGDRGEAEEELSDLEGAKLLDLAGLDGYQLLKGVG
ncbi:unnamed protein product [Durusdinium trenchii]|uniref:Suppressor of fused-like domain-containing protein n=1 Tax=Durusdinium trenchii TaxID=1381693 RepID=A0ABP0MMA0_9DINO